MNYEDVNITILNYFSSQHDAEVRMLESSSEWLTREWIEHVIVNQYARLNPESFAARSHDHISKPFPHYPLCSSIGQTAQRCKNYLVTKPDQSTNIHQSDENVNGGCKTIHPGCHLRKGADKSDNCPNQGKFAAVREADDSGHVVLVCSTEPVLALDNTQTSVHI